VIEFKRKEFAFKLDGEEYRVKNPSVRDIQAFQKESEGKKESEGLELTVGFLAGLGLPEEVSYGMEPGHLTQVVNSITDAATK